MENRHSFNSIHILRIFFTYAIITFHFNGSYKLLNDLGLYNGLYVATDFFFIVTGYLLYKSFVDNPDKNSSAASYTFKRFMNLLPLYWLSYTLIIVIRIVIYGFRETVYYALTHFFELFALHGIGLNQGWTSMNNSTWFISVMLLSGFVIYEFLKNRHDLFVRFIAPVSIIICISVIYRNVGSLSACPITDGLWVNYSFFRGFMEMCLGIYAYRLTMYIIKSAKKLYLFKAGSFILSFVVLILSVLVLDSKADFFLLFLEFLIVSFGFIPWNANGKGTVIIKNWSSLTVSIYLCHMFVVDYLAPYFFHDTYSTSQKGLLLLGCFLFTTILAFLLLKLSECIKKSILKKSCS